MQLLVLRITRGSVARITGQWEYSRLVLNCRLAEPLPVNQIWVSALEIACQHSAHKRDVNQFNVLRCSAKRHTLVEGEVWKNWVALPHHAHVIQAPRPGLI